MSDLATAVDEHRWLINNGLVTDFMKNNLIVYGYLISKEVQDVEVSIDVENKHVLYIVNVDARFISILNKFKQLSLSSSILSLWRVRRILKKYGNLHLLGSLSYFVKQLCGPAWTVELKIVDPTGHARPIELK